MSKYSYVVYAEFTEYYRYNFNLYNMSIFNIIFDVMCIKNKHFVTDIIDKSLTIKKIYYLLETL